MQQDTGLCLTLSVAYSIGNETCLRLYFLSMIASLQIIIAAQPDHAISMALIKIFLNLFQT